MGIFTYSVLDIMLQVLLKKFIWHFGVTWSISRQFTRRDMKPVAFLNLTKKMKDLKLTTLILVSWLSALACKKKVFFKL